MSKLVTIKDIEQQEFGGVFCMNNTPAVQRSQIVFTVSKMSGEGLDNVFIPATGFPVELTQQVTKKQLLNSSEFRRAVSQKLIVLISEEHYNEMMREDGAAEEVRVAMQQMTTVIDVVDGAANSGAADMKAELADEGKHRVHPQVILVCEQLDDGDLREMEALGKLRNLGELNKRSYQHISKSTKGHSRIQNWIKRVREEKFGE